MLARDSTYGLREWTAAAWDKRTTCTWKKMRLELLFVAETFGTLIVVDNGRQLPSLDLNPVIRFCIGEHIKNSSSSPLNLSQYVYGSITLTGILIIEYVAFCCCSCSGPLIYRYVQWVMI